LAGPHGRRWNLDRDIVQPSRDGRTRGGARRWRRLGYLFRHASPPAAPCERGPGL